MKLRCVEKIHRVGSNEHKNLQSGNPTPNIQTAETEPTKKSPILNGQKTQNMRKSKKSRDLEGLTSFPPTENKNTL